MAQRGRPPKKKPEGNPAEVPPMSAAPATFDEGEENLEDMENPTVAQAIWEVSNAIRDMTVVMAKLANMQAPVTHAPKPVAVAAPPTSNPTAAAVVTQQPAAQTPVAPQLAPQPAAFQDGFAFPPVQSQAPVAPPQPSPAPPITDFVPAPVVAPTPAPTMPVAAPQVQTAASPAPYTEQDLRTAHQTFQTVVASDPKFHGFSYPAAAMVSFLQGRLPNVNEAGFYQMLRHIEALQGQGVLAPIIALVPPGTMDRPVELKLL